MISGNKLKQSILKYLSTLSLGEAGRYKSCIHGKETLYASCFAAMIYHYLGELDNFGDKYLFDWANYILSFQEKDMGYFVGPEISQGKLLSEAHTKEHLSEHLTAHVLPTVDILGFMPRNKLIFAEKYLDAHYLVRWLNERNWTKAWIEGNNLLFVGQFLLFFLEKQKIQEAKKSLDILFEWLDKQIDPLTGLWGTNGNCDIPSAMYGGYHQLLLYYYCCHEYRYSEKLIDIVLSLQHFDGGFAGSWGGGTCEDTDGIDILVNMYKMTTYRNKDIILALKKAAISILRKMTIEGGFVYKNNEDFIHMGMEYTYAPSGVANIFSTWFYIYTLLIISEIINIPCTSGINYNFNNSCSMGWHRKSYINKFNYLDSDLIYDYPKIILADLYLKLRDIKNRYGILDKSYKNIKNMIFKNIRNRILPEE